jgi:hypothetical protein
MDNNFNYLPIKLIFIDKLPPRIIGMDGAFHRPEMGIGKNA